MTSERTAALRKTLDDVRARADLRARRAADPVDFVHQFKTRADKELVALVAANLAFGNVKAIRLKVSELLDRLAGVNASPSKAAEDSKKLHAALDGWKHRVFKGEDVAKLLFGARKVQKADGSLGHAFAKALKASDGAFDDPHEALKEALAVFCDRIRVAGGLPLPGEKSERRGPVNLLSNARAGGGAKRLLLFLRWMVRPEDGIDLGLWAEHVPASRLMMPVDVHIHKLSRNLGFTKRNDVSWKTAVEITTALAEFDASDPTRYDFSLCHLGMLQRCPSRKDPVRCEGCGVQPVCIRWQKPVTSR